MLPQSIQTLIDELSQLPGVGPRTAERLAFHILREGKQTSDSLGNALLNMHEGVASCDICHHLSEQSTCSICSNTKRDENLLAVVEEPLDVIAVEKTGLYRGLYHVLGGVLSPIDGMGPEQLNIGSLLKRLDKSSDIEEVILATNPSTEGEATALYIQRKLDGRDIKITRLARGLPVGSDLEYADQITLGRALEGRQVI